MLLWCASASAAGGGSVTVSTFASVASLFDQPVAVCADASGNLYIADMYNAVIRKVTPSGTVGVFAGLAGEVGSANGTGSSARFNFPRGICYDSANQCLYIADCFNHAIRQVTVPGGVVTTIAGSASYPGGWSDGTGSGARFNYPRSICYDSADGYLYVADTGNYTIRKVGTAGPATGVVTTIAGSHGTIGSSNGTGTGALFNWPEGICYDSADGYLYVTDTSNSTVRKVSTVGVVTTFAGAALTAGWGDGTGGGALFNYPAGICYDPADGYLYVIDTNNQTIRKITAGAVVTTLAGSHGASGSADGSGSAARFTFARGICYDPSSGSLYVTDTMNDTLRNVTTGGAVSTLVGPALVYNKPAYACADAAGNVYFTDTYNQVIRKVTPSGTVSVLAGSVGVTGGTNGLGGLARFSYPSGICYDSADGYLYVTDSGGYTIRKVSTAGDVTTIAGTVNQSGFVDATGGTARFFYPTGICYDAADGNLYVTDTENHAIRQVTTAGAVTTIDGTAGLGWADGSSSVAQFQEPEGICYDSMDGYLYVTDTYNHVVRKVSTAGTVVTIAGDPGHTGWVDGTGTVALFYSLRGICYDAADGYLYVTDKYNDVIRRVSTGGTVSTPAGTAATPGTADGVGAGARFYLPEGICYSGADGKLYVTDTGSDDLRMLSVDYTPVTTAGGLVADARSGWRTAPQLVTLSRDGAGTTYYRIDGGTTQTYSGPFTVSADGSHAVAYWSVGPFNATETAHTGYVNVDVSAPATTASGVPAGWSKGAVNVTLNAGDSLSGVVKVEYRLQGATTWTVYAAPFSVSAQGSTTYEFRATDAMGNVEATKTCTVRIDGKGPQTLALAKVSVTKGKKATFRFRVNDLTPTATVTIKIYKGKSLKKTITVGSKATNSAQSFKWNCKLAKGSYTWKVYAKDLAGNAQTKVGAKALKVK
jgi:DNA-binding beta-propeller fold protein YncE